MARKSRPSGRFLRSGGPSDAGVGGGGREVLERGERGGGGSGTPKRVLQKWPNQIFPHANFGFFPRWSLWSGGRGVRGEGTRPPFLLRCTVILTLPLGTGGWGLGGGTPAKPRQTSGASPPPTPAAQPPARAPAADLGLKVFAVEGPEAGLPLPRRGRDGDDVGVEEGHEGEHHEGAPQVPLALHRQVVGLKPCDTRAWGATGLGHGGGGGRGCALVRRAGGGVRRAGLDDTQTAVPSAVTTEEQRPDGGVHFKSGGVGLGGGGDGGVRDDGLPGGGGHKSAPCSGRPVTLLPTGRHRWQSPAGGVATGLSLRVTKKKSRARNTNRNEPSRGRSLLRGQDMGKTQDHRNTIEQRLAVGGWRLAVPTAVLNGCP